MTEETKLLYDANHTFREGYDAGLSEGMKEQYSIAADAVGLFIAQCGQMAEKHWLESQVQMLKWLMGAVLTGKEYDEYALADQELSRCTECSNVGTDSCDKCESGDMGDGSRDDN